MTNEPRMINKYWGNNPLSWETHVLFYTYSLDPHLSHTPLKYKYPLKIINHIRAIYLSPLKVALTQLSLVNGLDPIYHWELNPARSTQVKRKYV